MGTYQELIEIGKTGKSLSAIRKEKEKEGARKRAPPKRNQSTDRNGIIV